MSAHSVFYSAILPSLIAAGAVIGSAIFVWWNGRAHNSNEREQINDQAASLLVNDAMALVRGLRDEIDRLKAVNEEYRKQIERLQATNIEYGQQLNQLKTENALLRLTVKRIETRLLAIDPHYQPEEIVPSSDDTPPNTPPA